MVVAVLEVSIRVILDQKALVPSVSNPKVESSEIASRRILIPPALARMAVNLVASALKVLSPRILDLKVWSLEALVRLVLIQEDAAPKASIQQVFRPAAAGLKVLLTKIWAVVPRAVLPPA